MSTTTQTSTALAIIPEAAVTALKWSVTTKGGDTLVKQAHCATSQAFAPKAARLAAGQEKDLAQLLSGCYRPVLASVSAKLTSKQKDAFWEAGVNVTHEKPTKSEMVPFATAVAKLWAGGNGEKAAMAAMLQTYVDAVTVSVTA